MYDIVAGRQVLKPSYVLSKNKALELFPMLKRDKLVGALVYYDGMLPTSYCSGMHTVFSFGLALKNGNLCDDWQRFSTILQFAVFSGCLNQIYTVSVKLCDGDIRAVVARAAFCDLTAFQGHNRSSIKTVTEVYQCCYCSMIGDCEKETKSERLPF